MNKVYDVIILGAGPAGLSAGLYAARARMKTLILEKERLGGQITITAEIANYPGSAEDATGPTLIARMVEQVDSFGAERIADEVLEVDLKKDIKVIQGKKGHYKARTVIVSTGAKPRLIGCSGEREFTGKGVSYCATCDGDFFTDLQVYVVGGGDSAVEEALYLTKFARKVTIIHRRDELRAAKSLREKAFQHEKIDFIWDSILTDIKGDGVVQSMILKNRKTGEYTEIIADEKDGMFGIFVFIGSEPITNLFDQILSLDHGYIRTDETMQTSIPGVFAAGDCRLSPLKQVVTAVADGAIAAVYAEKYIENTLKS